MYPRINIDLNKLEENCETFLKQCKDNHITSCFAVVKVLAGNLEAIEMIAKSGFDYLADSRLDNLKKMRLFTKPKALMRLPMISEAKAVVKYVDLSLNSELKTIKKLNSEAKKLNKKHDIILMFDLGDLREGIFYQDDYIDIIDEILMLENICLRGIGTNLTCYGGVIPTAENLSMLVKIAHTLENEFDISFDIISGGNSSTVYLFNQQKIPEAINNLRVGEALLLGRETAYGHWIEGMHQDIFTLEAELIEVKEKPSYPIGEIGMNSFGEIPIIENRGMMNRGIVALGKQDIQIDNLIPIDPKIEVIGGSSDHLILDLKEAHYHVGDIVSFKVNYPGLLQVMTSKYVKKNPK
jgi:predicted amino acid racemase